jgi:hypothetical protein
MVGSQHNDMYSSRDQQYSEGSDQMYSIRDNGEIEAIENRLKRSVLEYSKYKRPNQVGTNLSDSASSILGDEQGTVA